jgi:hypothetical protein
MGPPLGKRAVEVRFLQSAPAVSFGLTDRKPIPRRLPPGRRPISTFHLLRLADESGVSGIGWVAEGAVFSNGWVVLVWPTGTPSLNFYESIEAVEAVHGHGGLTRIVFDDRS